MSQRVAVDIVFPLVRTITYKAMIMSNIIRNGDFSAGLSHWKANHGVDTGTDGGQSYARIDKRVAISQMLVGMQSGAGWVLRFEVAEHPFNPPVQQISTKPWDPTILSNPHRQAPMLQAAMALELSHDGEYWTAMFEFSVYRHWGLSGHRFDVPEGYDAGRVVIWVTDEPEQPDRSMAVRNVELFKV